MNAALNHLYAGLTILQSNEPIYRAEGDLESADFALKCIKEIEHGLAILEAAYKPRTCCTEHEALWKEAQFVQ
jgi:hypothetical protein